MDIKKDIGRKIALTIAVFSLLLPVVLSQAEEPVLILNFDSAVANDITTYTLGPGDYGVDATIYIENYVPTGARRNYGFMQPDPGVDTGNYPDIVTPSTAGFQGGNAFWTCTGNTGDSQQHIGWYLFKDDPAFEGISGDFTAEAIFMLAKIGTDSDPVVDSEYSLHNVFGTEMIAFGTDIAPDDGAAWKFRVWPQGIIGGTAQLQLCCSATAEGGAEQNVTGPTMSIDTWYHVAAVYTESTDTIELFLDGATQGTTNPDWANSGQNDWWIGAWPSNGANRGLAGWIDAVSLKNEVLGPSEFVLPRAGYTAVDAWSLY